MVKLTGRELEILRLVANSSKEIAVMEGISPKTVGAHFTKMGRKLLGRGAWGKRRRIAILRRALELDLIETDDLDPGPLRIEW